MVLFLMGLSESSIQLVPDGTIVFHGLLIILMVVVLNVTLFKPINKILSERYGRTQGSLEDARKMVARVEESLTRYEHSLREARAEGYRLLESQRTEAIREREKQISAAREQLGKQTAEAKQEIHKQSESARETLSVEAGKIALEISAQMLGRPLPSEKRV